MQTRVIAAYFRELRKGYHYTQQSLADAAGIGKRTVERLDRGDRPVSLRSMEPIMATLGASPDEVHYLRTNPSATISEAIELAQAQLERSVLWRGIARQSRGAHQDPRLRGVQTYVRIVRERQQISRKVLADMLGITITDLADWEDGRSNTLPVPAVVRANTRLNGTLEDLKQIDQVLEDHEALGRRLAEARVPMLIEEHIIDQGAPSDSQTTLSEQENVAGVYIEEGVSGRHDRRPSFQRLLEDIKQQRINVRALIIMDLDRFMRNLRLQLNVKAELDALGVRLISLNDDIDTSTPEGIIHFQMKGMLAEWFSNQLGRKVIMGIREKVQQGRWHGPMPVGYQKGADGILEPSADAEAVQLAFRLYATGRYSYLAVARELNTRGWRIYNVQTKARGLYNKWNLEVILKNPVYRGFVKFNDQLLPGSHPPLIDEETWNKVRAIVTYHTTKQGRVRLHSRSSGGGMLTEIAYCEHCNSRMIYQPSTSKNGRRYGYYRCSGNDRLTCQAGGVRTDKVEAQMLDVMRLLALPPEWRAEVIRHAEAMLYSKGTNTDERAQLEARKKRLVRLYTDGLMTETEYAAEVGAIQEVMATLESPYAEELDLRTAAALLADMPALLAASPIPEQRGILRGVFDRVWVTAHSICAIMPNRLYLPLASATAEVCILGGPGGHLASATNLN